MKKKYILLSITEGGTHVWCGPLGQQVAEVTAAIVGPMTGFTRVYEVDMPEEDERAISAAEKK